jgi:hypothetical protein
MPERHPDVARRRCSTSESESALSYRAGVGKRPKQRPIEDLEPVFEVELTEPDSALDEQLRREQTKAILDLLIAYKRRHPD